MAISENKKPNEEEFAESRRDKKAERGDARWHRTHDSHFIIKIFGSILGFIVLVYLLEFICSWGDCSFQAPQRLVDNLSSVIIIGIGYFLRGRLNKGR